MKKSILIVIILIPLVAISQWRWQNPLPQGNTLTSVFFTDTLTGYAVGEMGTMMKTIDGGLNWFISSLGSEGCPHNFGSVVFTENHTGYASGDNCNGALIDKTTDGGQTWNTIYSSANLYLTGLCFPDPDVGYAIGINGKMIKTINAGLSWTNLNTGVNSNLNSIFFIDNFTGFACGLNTIIKTTNGGASWTILNIGFNNVDWSCIWFTSSSTGYAGGDYLALVKTIDGGATWFADTTGINNSAIPNSLYFTSKDTGFISSNGEIYRTINAGGSWSLVQPNISYLSCINFPARSLGYAVGANGGILKTTNFGSSWFNLSKDVGGSTLYSVNFPSENVGYAVGVNGIVKTINGGNTWNKLNAYFDGSVTSVFFTDNNTGYVTKDVTIYKTINGGLMWTAGYSGTIKFLHSIFFVDANNGYCVGGTSWNVNPCGIILKTTDAGASWTETDINHDFQSVFFVNVDTGYAVGGYEYPHGNGIIYNTTDAGATWNAQSSGTGHPLHSVYFTDANTGYAVGDYGVFLKTVDGGQTWDLRQLDVTFYRSVFFVTRNKGYITGDEGTILRTYDAGETWTADSSGNWNSLYSVYFTDSITGYIAGSGGTILKTGNGGEDFITVYKQLETRFSITPNPANSFITINSKGKTKETITLIILDGQGKEVWKKTTQTSTPVDIRKLLPGLYLVRIVSKEGREVKKLVVD
jgi:photosystem II stability/assembly factor-like uncharacterized protein